jgi:hypothetical protein
MLSSVTRIFPFRRISIQITDYRIEHLNPLCYI